MTLGVARAADLEAEKAAEAPLLDIRGLKTYFATDDGIVQAVDGVDLTVGRGETVCVVGEVRLLFTHDNGKLTPASTFEKVKAEYDAKGRRNLVPTGEPDQHFPCDDVLVAVGQENAFPWIERDCGIDFDKWDMPKVDPQTMASSHPKVFFGGDAAFGPKNIIWAVAHGHEAAISIDSMCRGEDINNRPMPRSRSSARRWASTSGATTTTSRSTGVTGCRIAKRWSR